MKNVDVIRAWKNEEYRRSLSQVERAMLPAHPAGIIELADADLVSVGGAAVPRTFLFCPSFILFCPTRFFCEAI
jgi:mersacidin/lichenicidin family type 2 lantibiotic